MDFFTVPKNPKLLQQFNIFQLAWCPGHVTSDKTGSVSINTDMAQEGVAHALFGFCKTLTLPRNSGTGEVECITVDIHDYFHRIRIERLFCGFNRYCQRSHSSCA